MEQVAATSSVEIHAFGRVGYVRISGVIDQSFVPQLGGLAVEQLILDVGRVQRISSFGVRRWIEMIGSPPKGTEAISIIHAPVGLVDQLNLIRDFAGAAQVLTVLAPYECPRCDAERLALVDLATPSSRAAINAGAAPVRACPVCQQPLRFSENPSEYFEFFRSPHRPTAQPIVEHFLRLLRMPDGLDAPVPFKLLQGNVTYYQLRGKVMPNLNVRRMTGGLEGHVAFDFARVSSVEPGAQERLTALLEQSAAAAEVFVSRVPTAVLSFLSSAEPVKLASVMLQGQCKVCGEFRPHCVPAPDHLRDLRSGPPPDRPCPVCGGASMIQGAQLSGFLESHADSSVPAVLKVLEAKAFAHLLDEAAAGGAVGPSDTAQPEACKVCGGGHAARNCPTVIREPAAHQAPSTTLDIGRMDLSDLAAADSLVGRTVGNYHLVRILGEGSSARVYLGEHLVIGSRVAVKILHQSLAKDAGVVARFIREARTTSTVIHDNVVQVLDINTIDHNLFCIIMEYLDGQTLAEAFAKKIVPYEEAAPLLLQVCDALASAHGHGIVHRDLKPENVYLRKRAGRIQIKIVDFGIARRETLSDGENRTRAGTILGTPQYISPEQAFGLAADSRADIYSLGVIMFELATGRLPFEHESIRALLIAHCVETPPRPGLINPLVAPVYEEVILRALAKDPKDRYQTMADLGRAIAQARLDTGTRESNYTALAAPELSAATTGAAMRRHPRLAVELAVDVELPVAGVTVWVRERMTMVDISLSGGFVRSLKTIPEVFTRVVIHPLILGAQPLVAEVTRTTRIEDPETAAVVSGFGVLFIASEDSSAQERTIQAILALTGTPASGLPSIEAEIEQFLGRIEGAAEEDYYALLRVPLFANFAAIRNACTHLAQVLDSPQLQGLPPVDLARVKSARQRLGMAEEVLIDPIRRAGYDAARGNFVGIARCLASGLDTRELSRLREQFLIARPGLPDLMRPIRGRLDEVRALGDIPSLLEELTSALRVDPLDLDLQSQYWDVRRKLKADELVRE